MDLATLNEILARTEETPLSPEDRETLQAAVDTLGILTQELERKNASIGRLRRLMFGDRTEKTSRIFGGAAAPAGSGEAPGPTTEEEDQQPAGKPRKPGHGRNGSADYRGAVRIPVPHASLQRGQCCPGCEKGKVYPQQPKPLIRIKGMAPLAANVYEAERLRCNLCGEVFEAESPPGVGQEKYDETAAAMVAMFKYGAGLPFNRLEKLQRDLGIPLPAATQWELVASRATLLKPAYGELTRQAAQGEVLHNDDTTMKILALAGEHPRDTADPEVSGERTGVFTSGIVAASRGHRIALFFTGRKHAGENLASVLSLRAAELGPPIQMCDALSRNLPAQFETILGNCLAHGRRKFVEVADHFPEECRYVLETLRDVYKNDEWARDRSMTPEERLAFHQAKSGPLMAELEAWLREQIDEHKVEPNSGLGQAITYMGNHWQALTLFLRVSGAPLDNNVAERALKKAILHRKNSYFYKTQNGARVGDIYMSLIHTAELAGAAAFEYLVALLHNAQEVAASPADWMPWNYRDRVATTEATGPPT
ncbi:MAG: IS66 family transposase [Candidatus Sericytochromatia bacterium]|uniref:IS66 family transposase n=1 Tax=Candidatus Tanganyikabacteria bacterium TaxID=2961651 RepID=A0A937X1C0_9BACT|nr:IS66 family transposase [Candidatus Tanganyikabacteria bacterium]MBM3274181.1 IS66 family transposase [Candidatus Tanganyikabacteria bacterium]